MISLFLNRKKEQGARSKNGKSIDRRNSNKNVIICQQLKNFTMNNKIETFEDLKIWQRSMDFTCDIYEKFGGLRDYGFKDQIQRCSVSIPANIAEGFERYSNKEFIRFLFIARGSAGECRTLLYLARRLKFIDDKTANELLDEIKQLSSMTYGLIKTREKNFK